MKGASKTWREALQLLKIATRPQAQDIGKGHWYSTLRRWAMSFRDMAGSPRKRLPYLESKPVSGDPSW